MYLTFSTHHLGLRLLSTLQQRIELNEKFLNLDRFLLLAYDVLALANLRIR